MAKKRKLGASEIGFLIDDYDYIFSDFDPRPYSSRALSDDFLVETRKASKEKKSGNIQLSFLIPKKNRVPKDEEIIRKRLLAHFEKHEQQSKMEYKKLIKQGLFYLTFGMIIMFTAGFILFKFPGQNFIESFFVLMLEPAGWFLFWSGLDLIVFKSKEKKPSMEFYKKMAKADIHFQNN
jgi:hypothetical protein